MELSPPTEPAAASLRRLPPNVWATGATSFFMDISSEMVLNILPLFLANVLRVNTSTIGIIEGVAEAIASLLKLFSGWLSDRLRSRKWLAVAGYAISALSKPFFYAASSTGMVAAARWADRIGKGIRTAPRDALVADSVRETQRGLAFGLHRALDTAGAMVGLLIALIVVWLAQANSMVLGLNTFQTIVLLSLIPAFLAVATIALGTRDVTVHGQGVMPRFAFRALGKRFVVFMLIVSIFDLGNSSDAFLVLRAQSLGMSVVGILGMLLIFNLIYTLISTPAGKLSDRLGRRRIIIVGWLIYAAIYGGFALARTGWQVWVLYALYGLYYGLAFGASKALVADLVPEALRGTAYGTYNAVLGLLDFPASALAGFLWERFGAATPFGFGAALALLAALLMALWLPTVTAASPTPRRTP